MLDREMTRAVAHNYLEMAEGHNLRDHEYVAIPQIVKSDTGHPPNGAHLTCFRNPALNYEMDELLLKVATFNAYRR